MLKKCLTSTLKRHQCPLSCSLQNCGTFIGGKKKGRRHYGHWMNSVIQKEHFLSCKLARSGAGTGLSAELRVEAYCRALSLCPNTCAILLILDCFGFPAACSAWGVQLCPLCWWVQFTTTASCSQWVTSYVMILHVCSGQTVNEINAKYATAVQGLVVLTVLYVCVLVVHLTASGGQWMI